MKLLTALAALAFIAAPVNAMDLWVGNGTTKTETNRFTGAVTTTYSAKKGECSVTKSVKARIAGCHDMRKDSGRSIILITTSKGWEVMHYRASSNNTANVILTHKDGSIENTQLPAAYSGDVIRGGIVSEAVIITQVPSTVVSLEAQYGGVEYSYNPSR